jgi:hypothetical protein
VLTEIFLGRSDPERGIFARVPGRDTVYVLESGLAEHVPISLEAFRNRFASDEEDPSTEPEIGLDSES